MPKVKKIVRFNLFRIAIVEAIIRASKCPSRSVCSCKYCADLIHLSERHGFDFSVGGAKAMQHKFPSHIGTKEREGLSVLSIQHEFQLYSKNNIFEGFGEFPQDAYHAYTFFEENRLEEGLSLLKRQTAFILVSLAFPNSYLDFCASGQGEWDRCCEVFKEIDMPILDVPPSIKNSIVPKGYWTSHFTEQGCWNPIAGYGLEFGRDVGESSLKDYIESCQTHPDFFTWYDRTNQVGTTYGGFFIRTEGLMVSQQWHFEKEANNFLINTFNDCIAPIWTTPPQSRFDHVIVVYSSFRGNAYLASTDPRSWNPSASNEGILGPLPDGYGLVANWNNSDSADSLHTLDSFDSSAYTPRLRAAARYLALCVNYQY